ncbi:MAG: ABC transporter ATP-binding protein [Campylobacterota bacterium]|nr:ABC transporter ATP-binding protein [Campylobacterota bacterium]
MIKLTNVSCRYSQEAQLKCINLSVNEHLSILGSNGSGKSMLAKTLCGLLDYEGSITLDTQELRELSKNSIAKTISYIPSKLESFDYYTTVEEFSLLGRYPYKQPFSDYSNKDRDDVNATLKQLQLYDLKEQYITALSSGQQQLLLIAQSILQGSQIMIFDEPTANLDPYNTLIFAKLFQTLQESHTTILITHDLTLASHLKGSVLFVQDGSAVFYEESKLFFDSANLKKLYGVSFDEKSKAVVYA